MLEGLDSIPSTAKRETNIFNLDQNNRHESNNTSQVVKPTKASERICKFQERGSCRHSTKDSALSIHFTRRTAQVPFLAALHGGDMMSPP